jgi:RHS repeat-associated protein
VVSESRYLPFGELRWESGQAQTDFGFTGQRAERSLGLMDYNARFYSPRLGRFVSADSVVPNAGNPGAFDRYSYVMNNPLRYVDPTGHIAISEDGGTGGYEIASLNIAFVNVNLATSIPINYWKPSEIHPAAQYNYMDKTGLKEGYGNFCGHISLEMVYETVTGYDNTLGKFYQAGVDIGLKWNEGTDPFQLGRMFALVFPEGWTAAIYCSGYTYVYEGGGSDTPLQKNTYEVTWHLYDSNRVKDILYNMLDHGHYVIVSVYQNTGGQARLDPGGVKHWVVVTMIAGDLISINNPFTNRVETYSWDDFYNAFGYDLVEIIPPEKLRRPIRSPVRRPNRDHPNYVYAI